MQPSAKVVYDENDSNKRAFYIERSFHDGYQGFIRVNRDNSYSSNGSSRGLDGYIHLTAEEVIKVRDAMNEFISDYGLESSSLAPSTSTEPELELRFD